MAEDAPALHRALLDGESAVNQEGTAWLARVPGHDGPRDLAHRAIRQVGSLPSDCWLLCATSGSDPARDESPAPVKSLAQTLRDDLGLRGPAMTVQAACASSLVALGMAADLAASGQSTLVVAVDCISEMTRQGFASLGALSRRGPAPLSEERDGLALGEAAAAFLVQPAGGRVRIRGWGEACDARGLSRPASDGEGLRAAVAQACVVPPDLVVAHGTGTRLGDAAEAAVLAPLDVHITGTKAAVGHCLGAASGVDVALAMACLQTGLVPPLAGVRTPILPVLQEPTLLNPTRILVAAAGVGGFDAAVLLESA